MPTLQCAFSSVLEGRSVRPSSLSNTPICWAAGTSPPSASPSVYHYTPTHGAGTTDLWADFKGQTATVYTCPSLNMLEQRWQLEKNKVTTKFAHRIKKKFHVILRCFNVTNVVKTII